MTVDSSTEARPASPAPATKIQLVDCDVHPFIPQGVRTLAPYLSRSWRKRIFGHPGELPPQGGLLGGQLTVPSNQIYVNPAGLMRRDAYPEDGGMPGSDPDLVVEQLFEACDVDRAVMFLPQFPGILSLPDPDMAAAIASACNEWLLEQWLQHDSRFRAMMIVAPQDPDAAAAEIDRIGDRPGIVGVHVPMLNILMGERHFYPIYEAAQRHELPIGIHPNGVDGVHQRAAAFAGGNPTYYVEWHTSISQIFQGNVTSLVAHGVFERFPRLKLLAAEGGFAWLADVMWRFDKNWAGLRDEVPWVKRPPSEYILDHVRFTTQPFIEPSRREHLEVMLDIVGAERTLLFSSDYPHWDFDDPGRLLRSLPTGLRARVAAESALELFGDRLL